MNQRIVAALFLIGCAAYPFVPDRPIETVRDAVAAKREVQPGLIERGRMPVELANLLFEHFDDTWVRDGTVNYFIHESNPLPDTGQTGRLLVVIQPNEWSDGRAAGKPKTLIPKPPKPSRTGTLQHWWVQVIGPHGRSMPIVLPWITAREAEPWVSEQK